MIDSAGEKRLVYRRNIRRFPHGSAGKEVFLAKPFPVRLFENRLPGGCGVVADDPAAGVYANLVLQALIHGFGI